MLYKGMPPTLKELSGELVNHLQAKTIIEVDNDHCVADNDALKWQSVLDKANELYDLICEL